MQVRLDGIHHVKRKLADGTIRHHYYAWRGGPAIKAAPHTPAFALEFARHHEDARKVPTLTLADLVDQFTGPSGLRLLKPPNHVPPAFCFSGSWCQREESMESDDERY